MHAEVVKSLISAATAQERAATGTAQKPERRQKAGARTKKDGVRHIQGKYPDRGKLAARTAARSRKKQKEAEIKTCSVNQNKTRTKNGIPAKPGLRLKPSMLLLPGMCAATGR